ncbi:hypothetical protein [Bacillus sp. P14.5]|uniref:hypothetical protein n=1 Tax=Bacillus sp. P14.5 TaxID=1983400 RepID=UPI001F065CD8|nr:hypothetical protein [Bacillus sp. P14.5]
MNVPNMVGQIASRLAENGINIDNMVNRSRNDVAYTLIDIDNHKHETLSVHALYDIEGVMRVREF